MVFLFNYYNGRHLATNLFFRSVFFSEFQVVRTYWHCPLSCGAENEAMTAILVLSILINRSYFLLNALKPGICIFSGSVSLLALSIFYVGFKLRL